MIRTMKVSRRYVIWFFSLLGLEIAIAAFHFHPFIRGFVGDMLIVPLLYVFLRALFYNLKRQTAIYALLFAYLIEAAQWIQLPRSLGLKGTLIDLTLGNTFDPMDLIAYTLGFLLIIATETLFKNTKS